MTFPSKNSFLFGSLAVAWLIVIGIGFSILSRYENSPGGSGAASIDWPAQSQLFHHTNHPTLILFAHPRCPCTKATIEELALLMACSPSPIDAHVIFFKPPGLVDDWAQTDLWRSAVRIPGVKVHLDEGNREAANFHVVTSGHALLYDAQGRLLFNGGITKARGQSGVNTGRAAIMDRLNGHSEQSYASTHIFGCSLLDLDPTCTTTTASSTK